MVLLVRVPYVLTHTLTRKVIANHRGLPPCRRGSHRYYAQFCFAESCPRRSEDDRCRLTSRQTFQDDASRSEPGNYTGNVIGIDLGLKYFYKDQNDNAATYPKYLRRAEKRIKKLQRRLSRKFVKGNKPQSNNSFPVSPNISRLAKHFTTGWAGAQTFSVSVSPNIFLTMSWYMKT